MMPSSRGQGSVDDDMASCGLGTRETKRLGVQTAGLLGPGQLIHIFADLAERP